MKEITSGVFIENQIFSDSEKYRYAESVKRADFIKKVGDDLVETNKEFDSLITCLENLYNRHKSEQPINKDLNVSVSDTDPYHREYIIDAIKLIAITRDELITNIKKYMLGYGNIC